MDFKYLETTISSYIKDPANKVLVVSDPDTDVSIKVVEKYCKDVVANVISYLGEEIKIPSYDSEFGIKSFYENDVLLINFPNKSSASRFDDIMKVALRKQQEQKKPLIVVGWFNNDDVQKYVSLDKAVAIEVNYQVWMQWAKMTNEKGKTNIHPWVISFLEEHPEYWMMPPTSVVQVHPLTWRGVSANLARVTTPRDGQLDSYDKEDIKKIAALEVGVPMADIFAEYVQKLKNDPNQ